MPPAGANGVKATCHVRRETPAAGRTLRIWRPAAVQESPQPERGSAEAQEEEWVARTLDGDAGAFNRVVQAYSARILTHLRRIVRNREEAEDLAQETFVRAYRFLDKFDGRRPLRNWLYAIATHVGLNALRSRRRRPQAALEDLPGVEPVDPREDGRERAARGELEERVSEMLLRLPPRSALLVHLHYREGLSIAEAAEAVGMTEGAAKVALHRARRSLREWLVEEQEP